MKYLKMFGLILIISHSNILYGQFRVDYPIALNSFTGIVSVNYNHKFIKSKKSLKSNIALCYSVFQNKENSFINNLNLDFGIAKYIYLPRGVFIPYFNLGYAQFYFEKKSNNGLKTEIGFSKTFSPTFGIHSGYRRFFTSDFKFDNSTIKGNFGVILIGFEYYIHYK